MDFIFVFEQVLNGLGYGLMLFLIAAGLTLVFGIMDTMNLAHGSLYMAGAYVAAPAVKNIADRIAGFLGVERREDRWRTALGEKVPEYQDVAGDGL